jgi:hypothetical protein
MLFAAAFVYSLLNFLAHRADVLLDQHGFRQTQTAITAFWTMREGYHLAYPTPVTGVPWSIPFEFPLYQWIVAALATMTGAPLDEVGRSVSYGISLATLWPMAALGRALQLPRRFTWMAGAFYLASPFYLFWGKAFLIESLALFSTLAFLVCLVHVTRPPTDRSPRKWRLALAGLAATGIVAALVKPTTAAAAFLLAAAVATLSALASIAHRRTGDAPDRSEPRPIVRSAGVLVVLGVIYACLSAWTRFADGIKAQSPIGRLLTSDSLTTWNFGTLADRVGPALWSDTVLGRAVPEALGAGALLVFGAAIVGPHTVKRTLLLLCAAGLYLGPFLLFPGLHMQHNYYQYANAIYLALAGALVLSSIEPVSRAGMLGGVVLVLLLELQTFRSGYAPRQGAFADVEPGRILQVSRLVQQKVAPGAALLIFGCDWSSEIPYYSERKAVAVPNRDDLPVQVAEQPDRFLGALPLGGVVVCPKAPASSPFRTALARLTAGAGADAAFGATVYTNLHPEPAPH